METAALKLLLVDDDENLAILFRYLTEKSGRHVRLDVAGSGQEAIDYLAGQGPYADRSLHPLPDLVVLDLIMPQVSGFDFLDWKQGSSTLKPIPVIAFSGSLNEADKRAALAKGASRFLTKPTNLAELKSAVAEILDFGGAGLRMPDS